MPGILLDSIIMNTPSIERVVIPDRNGPRAVKRRGGWIIRLLTAGVLGSLAACHGVGGGPTTVYTVTGTIKLDVVNALPAGFPAGLSLTDGIDKFTVAAAADQFTFPTALPKGRSYDVTVTHNPPGLACTVSNGAGTIANAGIEVVVSCADAPYTLGGTVSGLTSAGLTVTGAAGAVLSVEAGASQFTLPGTVLFGSAYSVTVKAQPDHQTCAISGGAATMGAGNVTSVAIICPLSVSPQSASVAAGASQQFTATFNAAAGPVVWKVDGVAGGNAAVGTVSTSGLYTAPIAAATPVISATSTTDAGASASAAATVLAPHAIAVRQTASGLAEFYDRNTGNAWIARGNNFIRLASQTGFDGNPNVYHSTFNVGLYDSTDTENALAGMQASGYNSARVFLNGCCIGSIGDPAGGLSSAYMANVADFLSRAQKHGIYVIFTEDAPPSAGGYDITCPAQPASAPPIQGVNAENLCAGAVSAAQCFHRDFVQSLIQLKAPIGIILGYEARNEYFYDPTVGPLSAVSGMTTTANGSTYDMSDATSRQKMMDDGLVYLTDQVRAAIVAVDPTALVTVGFFWPQTPNPTRIGDTRFISVYPAMVTSTADFIDIHGYVILNDLTLDQLVQNYGFVGNQQKQPVIMAEYGVFNNAAPTISQAATALENWQIGGCGYGLKGWMLWTWDTPETVTNLWSALDGDGSVNQALAPVNRPDPCSP